MRLSNRSRRRTRYEEKNAKNCRVSDGCHDVNLSGSLRAEGTKRQVEMECFMRDLVHQRLDGRMAESYPEELLTERSKPMEIAILIPEVYMDKGKESDRDFQQLTIKNICMDLIDARRTGITFSDDDGKIVTAVYTSDAERNVTECVEELSEILENECSWK